MGMPVGRGYRPPPPLLGHVLRLRRRREAQDGDKDMDGSTSGGGELDRSPPLLLRGSSPHAMTAMVRITLDPGVLLREDVKKVARGSTHDTVCDFLGEFVAPANPSSLPIQEAGDARGRMCKGSVVLPLNVARAAVSASQRQLGVTCGP